MARPRPTRDPATRHPCLLVAFFLPCASRPPDVCRLRLTRPRQHYTARARATQHAYVTTRAGTYTMARRRQDTDEDEITEADNTVGDATFGCSSLRGTRQVTPPSMPADLITALAMPTTFGPKLFEITALHAVSAACKVKVKDDGDLLLLRDWLFEELAPPCMWTVMLSVVEWEHLTDNQKELHHTMRKSWLSSYNKASHTVRQHCLEVPQEVFKKQTESFAPLHKVFAKVRVDSTDSGTSAWREFSLCTPSQVHLSRTSSSLVASRRVSVSRMTPWLLLLTTSPLPTPLLLNAATCSPRPSRASTLSSLSWAFTSLKPPATRRHTKSFSPT
jgi:hypothetical protein